MIRSAAAAAAAPVNVVLLNYPVWQGVKVLPTSSCVFFLLKVPCLQPLGLSLCFAARGKCYMCLGHFILLVLVLFLFMVLVLSLFSLQRVDQPLGCGRGPLRQHLGPRLPAGVPEAGGLPPETSERGSVYRAHGHGHRRGKLTCGLCVSFYYRLLYVV